MTSAATFATTLNNSRTDSANTTNEPVNGTRASVLLLICACVIVVAAVLGVAVGSHYIEISRVLSALSRPDLTDPDHVIIWKSRIPRLALGIAVGAALAVAGVLMQTVTRNPLADAGLLGINAGASVSVVVGIAYFGVAGTQATVWWALFGAGFAAIIVYALGTTRGRAATPVRMALAGAAFAMAVGAVTSILLINNESTFLKFRYWVVGTLQGRQLDVTLSVAPFIVVGLLLGLGLVRSLDVLALGDETAKGLGARVGLTRALAALAVIVLAGAATAAAGPIGFVGLMSAHIVRIIVGPTHARMVPCAIVVGIALVLAADVAGRVVLAPSEVQTGISLAIIGAPVFIMVVRRGGLG